MEQQRLTFSKNERLTGEIRINELYSNGKFFLSYPFRVGYLVVPQADTPVKVMMAVPKKRFKRAVKRNRVKRLLRETYRKNKHMLYAAVTEKGVSLHLSITYIADEIIPFDVMNEKWENTMKKFIAKL